ncbi:hypothetical protein BUALT_Bualt01G0184200 [Buddleja alternifolia]|uniref:MIF4G domain-containing protein n=1 Tax=Buddleja alternifolia TaxID=168488 RepID=A0AAV6YIL7_9LAMI|nr:hypothetical protein BUALT_Bualt01G0184200 [Buddleja alternifolia]
MDPMQSDVNDQSIEYKNSKWFSMNKRIEGLVHKVNISNIQIIAREIMNQNLISGKGLFCQVIMKSQIEFPRLSNIYAALAAIINSQFPDVGLLLVKRVVLQFKEAYESKNKEQMEFSSKFLAHLVNQTVVYDVLAVNILLLLLGNPESDNVYVAVKFCLQCGSSLLEFSPLIFKEVFKEFNRVLRKGAVEKRVQVLILKLFVVKRSEFKAYPGIIDELDLVEVEDQVTHEVSLLHEFDPETCLDDFKSDLEFDELPCEGFGSMSLGVDGN